VHTYPPMVVVGGAGTVATVTDAETGEPVPTDAPVTVRGGLTRPFTAGARRVEVVLPGGDPVAVWSDETLALAGGL